ncbi:N-acetylmuramoyl-L-alanine amidase [Cellulosimicrobium cellulans]|uniref:N-acetylmuramoyl-L-alanine amidase n=1 Tax=Cellulosimicrobium cellulans TaxID=1710 RepID=UPI0009F5DA5E|nr:N-acetylmuramoyl-L-alanine amidase [Cellulosimicrobium cellulans]
MTHAPGPAPRRAWAGRLGLLLAGLAVGALTFLLVLQVRAGTSSGPVTTATPDVPSREAPPTPGASDAPATSGTADDVAPLAGLTVAVDPGHNGANAANPLTVNAPVPDGRGGTKACNTVGASTDAGYPEHAFAWDVASRLTDRLTALGAAVVLTRPDDAGVGPCVDARGRFPQEQDADVLVSVHANGTDDRDVRGFFAIVADPPVHEAQGEPSVALAQDLVDALAGAGFTPSDRYDGAVSRRADLATLNHAERPAVMLELGEMRNPEEAALMESEDGRQRYADAVAAGLAAWAADRDDAG